MLKFLTDKLNKTPKNSNNSTNESQESQESKKGLFDRFKEGLLKTRKIFADQLTNLFLGKKTIDAKLLEELETLLLIADVGIETTEQIIKHLTQQVNRKTLKDPQALADALQAYLISLLQPCEVPLSIPANTKPYVILMVGVNGAGKTTTIGKITKQLQNQGKKVLLAAGDTFRAAAIEQLSVWGAKNNVDVISQHTGSDSASVIFDAFSAAKARGYDVLIADTAGRLHTQSNLMTELEKIGRVLKKIDATAPHETMLILDATIGQNALKQAIEFDKAIKINSLSISKLDGTAKGGIIFAIAAKLGLPIRFIGLGEGMQDLKPFEAKTFVNALFDSVTTIENGKT